MDSYRFVSTIGCSLAAFSLFSAPEGFECVHGSAQLGQSEGGLTTIESSGRSVIQWDRFSIAQNEKVIFRQIGNRPAVLNRVVGKGSSHLLGTLQSNGAVYLINPHGVLIGPNARIQTNGFLASTADVLDLEFLSGRDMLFIHKDEEGTITHQGKIECPVGNIFLFSRQIDSQGELSAPRGQVGLAAASEIYLQAEGSQRLLIRPDHILETSISQTGRIEALSVELRSQGSPYSCAIRSAGEIDALDIVEQGGKILLKAESGKVETDGHLAASSIQILGDEVYILENSRIDAIGGEILVGGDFQGSNPKISNAQKTHVAQGAEIRANGSEGGKVIIWSDEHTYFAGHVEAKGGFVEVSGHTLNFLGTSDLKAESGKVGTLFLDPHNITISGANPYTPPYTFATTPAVDVTISGAALAGAINTGAVILQSNTDTTFDAAVTTVAPVGSLTVQAGRSVIFTANGDLAMNGAPFVATINDVGAIPANRDAGNAVFQMQAGSSLLSTTGDITVNFGSFGGTPEGYVQITGATIASTSGDINISGQGYGAAAAAPDNTGITIEGAAIISSGGILAFTGTGGDVTVNPASGVVLQGSALVQANGAGDLTINGAVGALATAGACNGFLIPGGSTVIVESTSSGNISITGSSASTDAVGTNNGISIASIIRSLGTGTMTFNGTGSPNSTGASNEGVLLTTGARLNSSAGDISITGFRGGAGVSSGSSAVQMLGNALIAATGPANVDILANGGSNPSGGTSTGFTMNTAGLQSFISTVDGDITINGTGSSGGGAVIANYGIFFLNASLISGGGLITTGSGGIYLTGLALSGNQSPGISLENSSIQALGTGDIVINGTSDTTGVGQRNCGFAMAITTGAPHSSVVRAANGDISITGDAGGGPGSQENDGVYISGGVIAGSQASIETLGAGSINIIGTSTGTSVSGGNNGVFLDLRSIVQSTSALGGPINIQGTGSTSGSPNNNGIAITDSTLVSGIGGQVQSLNGPISITGQAHGNNVGNTGVLVSFAGDVISTGSASITINGTGGEGLLDNNGVRVDRAGSSISSLGTGPMTITGQGGPGGVPAANQNQGIRVSNGGLITSVSGNGVLNGTGGGNGLGANNVGIDVDTGGDITTTGSATLTLTGTGGNGTTLNHGIQVDGAGSTIASTSSGALFITGNGSSLGTAQNHGIQVSNTGLITTLNGNILTTGSGGGNGTGTNNVGINIETDGDFTTTGSGSLTLIGNGGNGTTANHGIQMNGAGSTVASTGTGSINMTGNGSLLGTSSNDGILISGSSQVNSVSGAISVIGNGGGDGTGNGNVGVEIDTVGQINSTGAASITVVGTGGNGTSANYGVQIANIGSQINSSSTGAISVTGTVGAATAEDVVIEQQSIISSQNSAPILVTAALGDVLIQTTGAIISAGTGTVTVNAVENIRLEGGPGVGETAQIFLTDGDAFFNAGNDVRLISGTGNNSFVQIGNNADLGTPATADININAVANVIVSAGSTDSYALIGHGEPGAIALSFTGNINIFSNDVFVNGSNVLGVGTNGFGQIGHLNSGVAVSTLGGNILIDALNNIVLTGGTAAASANARVGHGGFPGPAPAISGNFLLIADVDVVLSTPGGAGNAQLQNLGPGTITCVVDDAFPTLCTFGPGQFILEAGSLIDATGGEVRIYTAMPGQNTINELINGLAFIPGPFNVNSATETWSTVYPNGAYGGVAFNLYYKVPCVLNPSVFEEPIVQLSIDNSQLTRLLPIYKLFPYDDYPYHAKMCIRDYLNPTHHFGLKKPPLFGQDCEPRFLRFRSMIFENYLR